MKTKKKTKPTKKKVIKKATKNKVNRVVKTTPNPINQGIKGYKVFLPDFTSKNGGMKFKENADFEVKLPIAICSHGLHFLHESTTLFCVL